MLHGAQDNYLSWPKQCERYQTSSQVNYNYGWINCLGYLDGNIFSLCSKPQTSDCRDYRGRKIGPSMPCAIAADENLLIRHTNTSWLWRAHDDRMLANYTDVAWLNDTCKVRDIPKCKVTKKICYLSSFSPLEMLKREKNVAPLKKNGQSTFPKIQKKSLKRKNG